MLLTAEVNLLKGKLLTIENLQDYQDKLDKYTGSQDFYDMYQKGLDDLLDGVQEEQGDA